MKYLPVLLLLFAMCLLYTVSAHGDHCGSSCGKHKSEHVASATPVLSEVWRNRVFAVLATLLVPFCSFLGMIVVTTLALAQTTFLPVLVSFGAGTMISSSLLSSLPEAFELIDDPHTVGYVVLAGVVCALVFEFLVHSISRHDHGHAHGDGCKTVEKVAGTVDVLVTEPSTCNSTKMESMAWNILISDGLHNAVDGILIGVTFTSSLTNGFKTTGLIILHELPQEVAELCILLHAGWPVRKALIRNAASTLTILIGVIAGLLLGPLSSIANYCMAFVAGEFLYIALGQLLPSMPNDSPKNVKIISNIAFFVGIMFFGVIGFMFPHCH
uniref:Uncharacterized protein n=1 Tax=Spongospora subterranea TaxID=70186 RepID=A0A0H5RBZ2_9EUKA|eukprot:CRZ11122.1 hypothetical protein [Spongospora subterranea]